MAIIRPYHRDIYIPIIFLLHLFQLTICYVELFVDILILWCDRQIIHLFLLLQWAHFIIIGSLLKWFYYTLSVFFDILDRIFLCFFDAHCCFHVYSDNQQWRISVLWFAFIDLLFQTFLKSSADLRRRLALLSTSIGVCWMFSRQCGEWCAARCHCRRRPLWWLKCKRFRFCVFDNGCDEMILISTSTLSVAGFK